MTQKKRKWLTLAVVAAVALILLVAAPRVLFRVLALLGPVMLVLSAVLMVLTFRRARRVSIVSLVISMTTSLLSFLVYQAFMHVTASIGIRLVAVLAGALLGGAWAHTAELVMEQGVLKSRGNGYYLAVWALIFALTQLLAIVVGRPPWLALLLLCVGTGLVWGNSGTMIVRARLAARRLAPKGTP